MRSPVSPSTLGATPPVGVAVGPFLAGSLKEGWKECRRELNQCQERFSGKPVHGLRIASRRLIARLDLAEAACRNQKIPKLRRVLKHLLKALGDTRDAQVQLAFLDARLAAFPQIRSLRKDFKCRKRRLARAASRKIERIKSDKLEKWVNAIASDPALIRSDARHQRRIAAAAHRRIADAFARVEARYRAVGPSDLAAIHKLRVAFKEFRYMVEAVSPVLTGLTRAQLARLARYQRKMGATHDLEVLCVTVERFAESHTRPDRVLEPFLRDLHRRQARALRSFLKSADELHAFRPLH